MCRKCIFMQTVKKLNLWGKTAADESAWIKAWIISTSRKLDDGLVTNTDQNRLVHIRYHVKLCYTMYKKKWEGHKVETLKRKSKEPDLSPLMSPVTWPKRFKTITSPDPRDKPCVICNHVKCQGDTKRFRIKSSEVADRLLKAANFNNDKIHIRLIFLKETCKTHGQNTLCIKITAWTSISASFSVTLTNCQLTILKIL